jgi:tetratricopeptide (TPR) repeat protein
MDVRMDKSDKQREKAKICVSKAERLMDNNRFKKSGEQFQKAAEIYFEFGEWKIAEQCFFFASKNFNRLGRYHAASNLQRLAANCSLLMHDFNKAKDYYDVALKTILKSDAKNLDDLATTSMCFAFLCQFIRGQQDEALGYVKRFKVDIDQEIFGNHLLVHLVRNLSNSIINEKEKYLNDILKEYPKFRFRVAEAELIKAAILVAMCSVYMNFSLNTEKSEYERDKTLELDTLLDISRLQDIMSHKILSHQFESVVIKNIGIAIGENISNKIKPKLPISIDLDSDQIKLPFTFRTNFPGEGYIGPLMLTIEIDGKFHFFLKSEVQNIKITSPKAVLGVNLNPQKTPVINQSFPLQVVLSNTSDGDAMQIVVDFEFPEELRMMRGTLTKNVYTLRPNEEFKWEIVVKASDVGEIPIKTIVSFKDGDGNEKGPFEANLPININL